MLSTGKLMDAYVTYYNDGRLDLADAVMVLLIDAMGDEVNDRLTMGHDLVYRS